MTALHGIKQKVREIMFEKFSEQAKEVMSLAKQEAHRSGSERITADHILLGIIQEGTGVAAKVLRSLDVNLDVLRGELEKLIYPDGPHASTLGQIEWSPRAKRVAELANEASILLGHNVVGTEHLLLGLRMENEAVAAQVLINHGLTLERIRDKVVSLVG